MKKNELTRKLSVAGCCFVRNGANHEKWYSPITGNSFMIPRHGAKEIATGTLKEIEKLSGVKF